MISWREITLLHFSPTPFFVKPPAFFKNISSPPIKNQTIVSSSVSALPWNIELNPFYQVYPPPPKKNPLNLSEPLFISSPLKILKNLTTPLKWTLVQKCKDSFFKETKDFISNNEMRTNLNVEIWIYSCKI